MGELHALGPGRRARRVVDGRRRRLVGVPRVRLDARAQQRLVGLVADHDAALARHVGERLVELGIDEQDAGTAVLDDVARPPRRRGGS